MTARIGLLTDFGTKAGYVASMKGVLLSTCGDVDCNIIDLSHDVSPQGIVEAAFFLDNCTLHFPGGFIFLIVVDPGVGTTRRVVCCKTKKKQQFFIAPDNGVLDLVIKEQGLCELVSVNDPAFWRDTRSHVFHGRDIMAPVAGHVARGVPLARLGEAIAARDLIALDLPPPPSMNEHGEIEAAVLYVDSFGNIITNIREDDIARLGTFLHDGLEIHVETTEHATGKVVAPHELYDGAVPAGELLCLMNSENRFEIAVNQGSAGDLFPGATTGTKVTVEKRA